MKALVVCRIDTWGNTYVQCPVCNAESQERGFQNHVRSMIQHGHRDHLAMWSEIKSGREVHA